MLVRIYRGLSGIIGTKASPYHNAERESARSACKQLFIGRHAQAFARICHGQSEAEEIPSTDLRRHWLLDQRSSETGVRCVYQGRLYSGVDVSLLFRQTLWTHNHRNRTKKMYPWSRSQYPIKWIK